MESLILHVFTRILESRERYECVVLSPVDPCGKRIPATITYISELTTCPKF